MKNLRELVLDGLKDLAGDPSTGLDRDQPEKLDERLLSMDVVGEKLEIRIGSDGLTLSQKGRIEQELVRILAPVKPADVTQILVYFKRQNPLAGPVAGGGGPTMAPLKTSSGAFGLKIAKTAIPGVREIIAVASGKGGVGKSTVSVNLAVALAGEGKRVGLLDADIYGPSAPLMMGLQGPMPVVEGTRLKPLEKYGVKVVSFGFFSDSQNPVIWRGPVVSKALRQMCFDTQWGDLDYLIIDFPPGTGDVQLTLIESIPIHGAIIVSTPQDVALLDAHKGLTMFEKLGVPVLGLVENMAYHICRNCGHQEHLFGHEAMQRFLEERKIPLLGKIQLLSEIRQGADAGTPPAAIKGAAWGESYRELARKIIGLN